MSTPLDSCAHSRPVWMFGDGPMLLSYEANNLMTGGRRHPRPLGNASDNGIWSELHKRQDGHMFYSLPPIRGLPDRHGGAPALQRPSRTRQLYGATTRGGLWPRFRPSIPDRFPWPRIPHPARRGAQHSRRSPVGRRGMGHYRNATGHALQRRETKSFVGRRYDDQSRPAHN